MGKSLLKTVISLLNEGDVLAAPAKPEKGMLVIHAPVAAVSMEKVDTAEGSATVLVEVVAPMKNPSEQCQRVALEVCRILSEAGAECILGGCSFESRSALFCVPVTARFYGTALAEDWIPRPTYSVTLAGTVLAHVTGMSAEQVTDEGHGSLASAPWVFTLEEFLPIGAQETEAPEEMFSLNVECSGRIEYFHGCLMTDRKRVLTAKGVQQIRKGTALSRTMQVIADN